jgi:phosphocarrier protein HPr
VQNTVYEIEVQIKNAAGLHMRPAMQFVDVSNKFQSVISVNNGQVIVDGKSIMQVSTLMATCGTRLKIRAEGADAAQAAEELRELVEVKRFDEPTPEELEKGTMG